MDEIPVCTPNGRKWKANNKVSNSNSIHPRPDNRGPKLPLCTTSNWKNYFILGDNGFLMELGEILEEGTVKGPTTPEKFRHETRRCDCKRFSWVQKWLPEGNSAGMYYQKNNHTQMNIDNGGASSSRSVAPPPSRNIPEISNPETQNLDHPDNFWLCRKCWDTG